MFVSQKRNKKHVFSVSEKCYRRDEDGDLFLTLKLLNRSDLDLAFELQAGQKQSYLLNLNIQQDVEFSVRESYPMRIHKLKNKV